MEFTPPASVPAVLAFLGTCLGVLVAGVVASLALLLRNYELARRLLLVTLAGLGFYAAALLGVSLLSEEKVLAAGEWKYFCEVDCHLAYTVVDVTTTKTLGAPAQPKTAEGNYYVVTLKVWFDENTISSHRVRNLPLAPNDRRLAIVGEQGRTHSVSLDGQQALEQAEGRSVPLCQPLRPGDSYTTRLVFDLPAELHNPRLLLATADPLAWLIIGHESSLLHQRILFRLEPRAASTPLLPPG